MYPRHHYHPHDPTRPGGRALSRLFAPLGGTRLSARARGVVRDLFLLCLSLAFAAVLSVLRADTIGPVQALGEVTAIATAYGAVVTVYGLYLAGQQLRRRDQGWAGDQLCASLATISFGLATVFAAQVLRLLGSSGQLPIL